MAQEGYSQRAGLVDKPLWVSLLHPHCPDLQASFRASEPRASFLPAAYTHFRAQLWRLGRRLITKGQFGNNGVSIKLWAS